MRGNFFYKKLGRHIEIIRKKKKLSQEELAWIAELDRTYLARIEVGRANPSIRVIHKIARKLRVKIRYLFGDL